MERLTIKTGNGYYINIDNIDKNINDCRTKLGKLEDIEEELGCPLEVRCKIVNGLSIYDEYGQAWIIDDIEEKCIEVHSAEDSYYLMRFDYIDYKKTWWLKADKSE